MPSVEMQTVQQTRRCGCVEEGTARKEPLADWSWKRVSSCPKHADGSCTYCDKAKHSTCSDCDGEICKGVCFCDLQ